MAATLTSVMIMNMRGVVFSPTDDDILTYFLKGKVEDPTSFTNYHTHLTEINNLFDYHPQQLLDGKSARSGVYFFVRRDRNERNLQIRTTCAKDDGYWESTQDKRKVIKNPSPDDAKIGSVRKFVFHIGKPPTGTKTEYEMHEYDLIVDDEEEEDDNSVVTTKNGENTTKIYDWVMIKVFKPHKEPEEIMDYFSEED